MDRLVPWAPYALGQVLTLRYLGPLEEPVEQATVLPVRHLVTPGEARSDQAFWYTW